jgi:aminopeptidase
MKTIEHVHLGLLDPDQYETYINALNFDPREKGKIAYKLKHKLDVTKKITVVSSGGCELTYESEMEPALLNIGDYSAMKNVGGTFPVGEVFSEPKDLSKVNGEVMVWGFPNTSRVMDIFDIPFKVKIEKGVISSIDADAPTSFKEITDIIKNAEGEILVREFGLGLNSAMSKQNVITHCMHLNDTNIRICTACE